MVIEQGAKKDIIDITKDEKKENEGKFIYKVNGKDINEAAFKEFYQSLIGLTLEGENKDKVQKNEEIKIKFVLNNESNDEVKITYYGYNNDFYSVSRDSGKAEFLI